MTKKTLKPTLESAGATCAGSVATVATPLGATQRRNGGNLLSGTVSDVPFPNTPFSPKNKRKRKTVQESSLDQEPEMTNKLDEISSPALKKYVKAAGKDLIDRASSDSFRSGQAGDKYNKADSTHRDTRRERGIERALDKLSGEKTVTEDEPCWDNYEMVGMKTKNGKKVPNCVPKTTTEESDQQLHEWSSWLHEELDLLTAKDSPRRKTGLNNRQEEKTTQMMAPVSKALQAVKGGLKRLPPDAASKLLASIETLVAELKSSIQKSEGAECRSMVEAAVKTLAMMAESVNRKVK